MKGLSFPVRILVKDMVAKNLIAYQLDGNRLLPIHLCK
jgi:hypothetical protein